MLELIILFCVGFIDDILIAGYTRAVGNKKPIISSLFSLVITIESLVAYRYIIVDDTVFIKVLCFALGGMVGTYFIIKKGD